MTSQLVQSRNPTTVTFVGPLTIGYFTFVTPSENTGQWVYNKPCDGIHDDA